MFKVYQKDSLILITKDDCLYSLVSEDKTEWSDEQDTLTIHDEDTDNPEELAGYWDLIASFKGG